MWDEDTGQVAAARVKWSLRISEDLEEPLVQRPVDGYPQLSVLVVSV